jgi:hypothetical protein
MDSQFEITSRPRHLRYVFFVDENYPYEKMFALIHANQSIWGGRYNPIVPVKGNIILENWKAILQYYDPDFVFYSKEIDVEIIKRLRYFNPCGYYNLDEQPKREDITGVDAFYFLSQFDSSSKIILPSALWKTESPLLDFYKINFGLEKNGFVSDYEIGKNHPLTIIDSKNFASLNQIIHDEKPINRAHLARRNLNTRILRNLQKAKYNDFEIVISKDKSSIADLIYFWNRLLFEGKSVLYVSVEELNLLTEDKIFGNVLYDMNGENTIGIVSMTLSESEIDELIKTRLTPIASTNRFQYKNNTDFPFEVLDGSGLYERDYGESQVTQTLISRKGLFYLPKLSFTPKVSFYSQKWAIDIQITMGGDDHQLHNQVEFPLTTETQYIVKNVKGRINQRRNISIFIQNQQNISDTLEIDIPEFKYLVRQLISRPVIHGEAQQTKYIDIGSHDDSNKLSAFLKSFRHDFVSINDFFTDKFWVTVFEELIKSERATKDSISFSEIIIKCKAALAKKGIVQLDENGIIIGKKGETYKNEENLRMGMKQTIAELCDYKVFLRGFHLKCNKCSSQFWYPLKEISETVTCKGCLEDFNLEIEPSFGYKLNDLIKNNMFKFQNNNDKLELIPDGNLTVIRTLISIHRRSLKSFQYSPQLNLYDNPHTKTACGDIDIVCISEGKLIIGEAKHSSSRFFDKNIEGLNSLDKIIELSNAISPDKIILSCYEDNYGSLNKAKKYLDGKFYRNVYAPEIEILLLHIPDDIQLGHHRYFRY